ncbi:hypothetical protein BT63DRAFT_116114 [Microthyrium microscopicum]|uniref:Uncharacterized protein n=1 Tax=Microthyrium microscopicum TaxID=703497 RepID=A0A6A6TXQ6_9PEZI|nr:hypothetical protein BT63DRAFT_116114 [Microthyrium microscopicum]
MSTLKPQPTDQVKTRPPKPALFVGPPSRNASSQSLLPNRPPSSSRTPLTRQKSLLGTDRPRIDTRLDNFLSSPSGNYSPNPNNTLSPYPSNTLSPYPVPSQADGIASPLSSTRRNAADSTSFARTEAKWAEMQSTLEEVELSATNGAHVFGPGHVRALDDLRTAQIALAQAWARSEAEEASASGLGSPGPVMEVDVLSGERKSERKAEGEGRERAGTGSSGKSVLAEETENDIAMARRRREANDGYFRKVNAGVKDVVAKLEEVAKAMKGVEMESREIWGDRDSVEDGSVS